MFSVFALFRGNDLLPVLCAGNSDEDIARSKKIREYFADPHVSSGADLVTSFVVAVVFERMIDNKVMLKPDDVVVDGGIIVVRVPVQIECVVPGQRHDGLVPPCAFARPMAVFKRDVAVHMFAAQSQWSSLPLPQDACRSLGVY